MLPQDCPTWKASKLPVSSLHPLWWNRLVSFFKKTKPQKHLAEFQLSSDNPVYWILPWICLNLSFSDSLMGHLEGKWRFTKKSLQSSLCLTVRPELWRLLGFDLLPFLALYPALSFFWGAGGWGGWCSIAWEILVPWPGIETVPSAVGAWSPNQWTTREVPSSHFKFCSWNQIRWGVPWCLSWEKRSHFWPKLFVI